MDMASTDLTDASADAAFADRLEICGKCCRKLEGEGKKLRKAVQAAVRSAYGDAIAVEKTDCFSLCPKGGQVVAAFSKKAGRRLVILQPQSDVELAVEYLLRKQR